MTVQITCIEGRFNFLDPSQKQWQLSVRTPFGNVRELFNEEPYWDGTVEDALGVIEERTSHYLYSSTRDETRLTINKIRERLLECEVMLLERIIAADEREVARLTERVAKSKETIALYRQEMAEAAP